MKKYFYFLLFIFLTACNKNDDKLTQSCENFPPISGIDGYTNIVSSNNGFAPSFNPNNTQELCFGKSVDEPGGDSKIELWKVNLATGQQQKITDEFWGEPDWGKNGWILLEKPGNQIYKIKSNGDSLTALPFQDVCYNPKWNNPAGTFLHNLSGNDNARHQAVERKATGEVVRYLVPKDGKKISLYQLAISPDGSKLVSSTTEGFFLYDYPDLNEESLGQGDRNNGQASVNWKAWAPDNINIFWTSEYGLFKTNVVTKQTWQLKTGCQSRSYNSLAVSPDGQTLAVTRYDTKLVDENNLTTEINIYLMDTNGDNERKMYR